MEIDWLITEADVAKVHAIMEEQGEDPYVLWRIQRNVTSEPSVPTRKSFWYYVVACLLTSQQRSGPTSAVSRFLQMDPFPLDYEVCRQSDDLRVQGSHTMTAFGGLRFTNRIPDQLARNLERLESGHWEKTFSVLDELCSEHTASRERKTANFVRSNFVGFGPKQSRNLLQSLGLTRYEIPLDSRIAKWLNEFGFPVKITASALNDPEYYSFVSDGVIALCRAADLYPCVLDAAIFSSFDTEPWSDDIVF